jgi:Trm5-related predicted tRNA methylase
MPTITIDVPENVPVEIIKRKIQKLIKEEQLKWELFEKAKEELNLTEEDLKDFEKAREEAWKEIKKKYGL